MEGTTFSSDSFETPSIEEIVQKPRRTSDIFDTSEIVDFTDVNVIDQHSGINLANEAHTETLKATLDFLTNLSQIEDMYSFTPSETMCEHIASFGKQYDIEFGLDIYSIENKRIDKDGAIITEKVELATEKSVRTWLIETQEQLSQSLSLCNDTLIFTTGETGIVVDLDTATRVTELNPHPLVRMAIEYTKDREYNNKFTLVLKNMDHHKYAYIAKRRLNNIVNKYDSKTLEDMLGYLDKGGRAKINELISEQQQIEA